jgi:ferric-dicitrate binding protein FerR (iron transport regulator)
MTCDQSREALSTWLTGELSEHEVFQLDGHLPGCAECAGELDRLLLQDRALSEMAGASLSDQLREKVHRGLAQPRTPSLRAILSVAATLLVAVGATVIWMLLPAEEVATVATLEVVRGDVVLAAGPASRGSSIGEGQGVETRGAGSAALLRFQDGTELELRGDTQVDHLSDAPAGGKRAFLRKGTMRSAIVHQPAGRPMIVTSPHAQATILGTRMRLVVDSTTRIEVEEGKVGLTRTSDGAAVEIAAGSFVVAAKGLPLVAQPLVIARQSLIVEAGETHTLAEDLVLSGDDTLEIRGTADKRCTLKGNRHRIRTSGEWTGRIRISHGDLVELGDQPVFNGDKRVSSNAHALELHAAKDAEIAIDHSTFRACSSVSLRVEGTSTVRFCDNVSGEDSIVWVDKAVERSIPFFAATGNSNGPKAFQGNRIYRSNVNITGRNWMIGGATDAESNLIIGLRAGLFAYGDGTVVRGNYLHCLMPRSSEYPYWSQVATFTSARGALAERNVIRDGEWIVQFVEGEFRDNLICDINDHNFLRNGSTGRIHHNIFVAGRPDHPPGSQSACIFIVYPPKGGESGAEIFNNTFDAGDALNVPGVEVNAGGLVKSLRNNVFFNFPHGEKYMRSGQAMVRPAWTEPLSDPAPTALGYADYNAFFSPRAKVKKNYALAVAGKTERKDAGFALNDLPRGGARDEQVDPKFKGPIPSAFLFDDKDIKSGAVTVSTILARYRDLYSPGPGSPLIDAGDPADGEGTDIGAVADK